MKSKGIILSCVWVLWTQTTIMKCKETSQGFAGHICEEIVTTGPKYKDAFEDKDECSRIQRSYEKDLGTEIGVGTNIKVRYWCLPTGITPGQAQN